MRVKRHPTRADNLRRALAQEAARLMAEHGIRDFLVAKRKAAERLGVTDGGALLPKNSEIEEALAAHQRLFGGASHVEALTAQSRAWWARCSPAPPPSIPTCSCTCSPTRSSR